MTLEISSVTGSQNIGGVTQPVIGQRRIEHDTRLGDGEVNLVGGILEKTETQSLSGYPWLAKIPILKYLFAQEDKEQREREIVFAITPHIIRAQDLTQQNLRLVDVGTGSSTVLRHTEPTTTNPDKPAKKNGSNPATTPLPHPRLPHAPPPPQPPPAPRQAPPAAAPKLPL